MKYDNLLKVINEAIPLSTVKPYLKKWKNESPSKKYFEKDPRSSHHKYRMYIPLSKDPSTDISDEDIERELLSTSTHSKAIRDTVYFKFHRYGYQITSYIKNLAIDKHQRPTTIVKLMNKIISKEKDDVQEVKALKETVDAFINDPGRSGIGKKNLLVVFSRHPYDILGMSTDRGWTSCKSLGTKPIKRTDVREHEGCNRHYLDDEIHSLIVAYLINEKDKNIQNPIARINLIPFYNSRGEIIYFANLDRVYGDPGIFFKAYTKTIKDWLEEKQKDAEPGKYLASNFVYHDGIQEEKYLLPPNEKIFDWFFKAKTEGADYEIEEDPYDGRKRLLWNNGTWKGGTWIGRIPVSHRMVCVARWENGVFENGTWETGLWANGTWKNGTWKLGNWKGGIWENGTWKDGTWNGGVWKGGTWEKGKIPDNLYIGKISMRPLRTEPISGIADIAKSFNFEGVDTSEERLTLPLLVSDKYFSNRAFATISTINPNEYFDVPIEFKTRRVAIMEFLRDLNNNSYSEKQKFHPLDFVVDKDGNTILDPFFVENNYCELHPHYSTLSKFKALNLKEVRCKMVLDLSSMPVGRFDYDLYLVGSNITPHASENGLSITGGTPSSTVKVPKIILDYFKITSVEFPSLVALKGSCILKKSARSKCIPGIAISSSVLTSLNGLKECVHPEGDFSMKINCSSLSSLEGIHDEVSDLHLYYVTKKLKMSTLPKKIGTLLLEMNQSEMKIPVVPDDFLEYLANGNYKRIKITNILKPDFREKVVKAIESNKNGGIEMNLE